MSPYAYVGNNPINKTDPDGNCPCLLQIWEEVGAAAVYEALFASTAVVGTVAIIAHAHNSGGIPIMEQDATRTQRPVPPRPDIVQSNSNQKDHGSIYKVPGSATPSGKPYVGRHNKPTPQKTRKSNDGRDRKQAEVIDTYDTNKPGEGRDKEQKAIDENGGVENLDNKRNEVKKDPPPKADPPKTDPPKTNPPSNGN